MTKNIPGKRRPRGKAKPVGEKLAVLVDQHMLHWIRFGVKTWTGQLDDQRNPIMYYKPMSAAHMAQIIKRLGQIRDGIFADGKSAKSLVDMARERGIGAGGASFRGRLAVEDADDRDAGDE